MSDIDQVLRALNHPVRRRILEAIAKEPRSSKSLSQEFKMELTSVAYHLNLVLNRDCEIVELVDTVPRRGALEKFLQINVDALRESVPDSAEKGEATVEEWILALVLGIAQLPEDCPPPFKS